MDKKVDYLRLSNINCFDVKLRHYYNILDTLDDNRKTDNRKAITLHGIRRSGKSSALNQVYTELMLNRNESCMYIRIRDNDCSIYDLEDIVCIEDNKNNKNNIVIIDEVTRVIGFENGIGDFIELCINANIQLILAGTESYLLTLASYDNAYDRFIFISTSQYTYNDAKNIYEYPKIDTYTFEKYVSSLKPLSGNIYDNLVNSILHSIKKSTTTIKNPIMDIEDFELKSYIQAIIDAIVITRTSDYQIKEPKIISDTQGFGVDSNEIIKICLKSYKNMSKLKLTTIFKILTDLKLIYSLNNSCNEESYYYASSPALYMDCLSKGNKELGVIAEASIICNILYQIEDDKRYVPFTYRSTEGSREIDLCIEDIEKNTLHLIEIKYDRKKNSKHFSDPMLHKDLDTNSYNNVSLYKLYVVDNSLSPVTFLDIVPKTKDDVLAVSAEKFVLNLFKYLK